VRFHLEARVRKVRLRQHARQDYQVGTIFSLDRRLTTMASSSSSADPQGTEIERTGMAQITLNESLAWLKTLKKRHEELVALRDGNAHRERREKEKGPSR
jgi:hypothetical protein